MFRGISFFRINFLFLVEILWQPSNAIVKLSLAEITNFIVQIGIYFIVFSNYNIAQKIDWSSNHNYINCNE